MPSSRYAPPDDRSRAPLWTDALFAFAAEMPPRRFSNSSPPPSMSSPSRSSRDATRLSSSLAAKSPPPPAARRLLVIRVTTPDVDASRARSERISRSISSRDAPGTIPRGFPRLASVPSSTLDVPVAAEAATGVAPIAETSTPGNRCFATCLSMAVSGAPPRLSMSFSASTVLSRSARSVCSARNLVSRTEGEEAGESFSLAPARGLGARPFASRCRMRLADSSATARASASTGATAVAAGAATAGAFATGFRAGLGRAGTGGLSGMSPFAIVAVSSGVATKKSWHDRNAPRLTVIASVSDGPRLRFPEFPPGFRLGVLIGTSANI